MDEGKVGSIKKFELPIPLLKEFYDGNVVIIIGSGVSSSAGIISGSQLAISLYDELLSDLRKSGESGRIKELERLDKTNLREISQKHAVYYSNNDKPKEKVRELILESANGANPEVFQLLNGLPICDIITTNYDRMIEKCQTGANHKVVFEKKGLLIGNINKNYTNILKIHGDLEDPESMVLTKHDYDDYDKDHPKLLQEIKQRLEKCTILMIGYSLEDENLRRFVSSYRNAGSKRGYWITSTDNQFREDEWQNFDCKKIDANEYLRILVDEIKRYQEENPKETMEISKKAESSTDKNPFKFYKTDSVPFWDFQIVGQYFVPPVEYAKITEPGTHTIIEGDRGSGKSMVLRFLSLETQLSLPEPISRVDEFIGFYIKMDPGLVETAARSPSTDYDHWITFFTHFLNLLFTERIIEIINLCHAKRLSLESDKIAEKRVCKFIGRRLLSLDLGDDADFLQIISLIRDERENLATIDRRNSVTSRTSTRYIFDLINELQQYSKLFQEKPIYLLIDEVDNFDEDQLKVLNLFLRTRDAPISYKIGVKTGCMKYTDPKGKKLELGNDYEHLYCDRFIRSQWESLREFFEKLANTRLQKNGYDIDIKCLLPMDTRIKYSGFENYCYLSSGIIRSYITLIKDTVYNAYPEIVETKVTFEPIPAKKQETVIKIKSRIHFNNYGGCEHPLEVKKTIEILGSLFKQILYHSRKRVADDPKKELRTVSQIEIKNFNNLSPFMQNILKETVDCNLLQIPLGARSQEAAAAPFNGYKLHRMIIPYFSLELPNRFPRTLKAEQVNVIEDVIYNRIKEKDFLEPIIKSINFDKDEEISQTTYEFDYGTNTI